MHTWNMASNAFKSFTSTECLCYHFNCQYLNNYYTTSLTCMRYERCNKMGHGIRKSTDKKLGSRTPIFVDDANPLVCHSRIILQNISMTTHRLHMVINVFSFKWYKKLCCDIYVTKLHYKNMRYNNTIVFTWL